MRISLLYLVDVCRFFMLRSNEKDKIEATKQNLLGTTLSWCICMYMQRVNVET